MTHRDMSDVRGLPRARRALEVAAAGRHHLLLVGPAGCGKSLLAFRLPGLLPSLAPEVAAQVRRLHSLTGRVLGDVVEPPFRAPHHTVSVAGLTGEHRGFLPRSGELGLAHGGVLLLEDFPEFSRGCLDALREPLKTSTLTLHSGRSSATMPADFLLVATMTACPCGYRGHPTRACVCSAASVSRYVERVRPLARFFEIVIDLTRDSTAGPIAGEDSATIRARVACTRETIVRHDHGHCVASTLAAMEGSTALEVRHQDEAAALRADFDQLLLRMEDPR